MPSDGRGPGARREASTTPHGLHATEAAGRRRARRRAGAGPTRERAAALAERLAGELRRPAPPRLRAENQHREERRPRHRALRRCGRGVHISTRRSRRRRNNNAGTDVGPKGIGDKVFLACSPDNVEKYKLRTWAFDGEIVGDRIDAGDGVHAGTWNVNFKGAENPWTGIRWKDGNRWLKLEEE